MMVKTSCGPPTLADVGTEEGSFVVTGKDKVLSLSQARSLGKQYEQSMQDSLNDLISSRRVGLIEVRCSADSRLSAECIRRFGPGSAVRLSYWNGGDIETEKGRTFVIKTIKELRPDMVWISPECGPYSPLQRTNQRTPEQRASLECKRQQALAQYEGASQIRAAHRSGCHCVLELSERCEAWNHDWYAKLHVTCTCIMECARGAR